MHTLTHRLLGLVMASLVSNAVAAATSYPPAFDPGYRPEASSDEGGFWYQVDKLERDIQHSPFVVTDPALNDYVGNMVCKLAGDYCSDIRVYVIENPHFNAAMFPNGMMHIHSGLLLRVESESQLAAVLGHEIGHYLRSHHLKQWRGLRDGAGVSMVFDMLLTGGLMTWAVMAGNSSFGRNQEIEADAIGANLMHASGYAPVEAANLWRYVDAEQKADSSRQASSVFFATHPQPKERIAKLEAHISQLPETGNTLKNNGLIEKIMPLYRTFMANHLEMQEYEQSELLLAKHEEMGYPEAEVRFFRGELHRLRNQPGDQDLAVDAYTASLKLDNPVPDAHKHLGYLHLRKKNNTEALSHFRNYLALAPDASDKQMIEFYINSLESKND
ncbi:M48 family metallopeptidase [Biformimicrobium ophioploci]|uniref:Peptidase M48 domain-containing protein n=1 Tax=Biformimicrobium ophioploci TaxID=3036711 RepID=A0ABQ6LV48_9GAMM|nr:M48 family metallopeptidase [Microbulbifer sp. NKW57]GMG85974.1 hypothetical protein MNKW57_02950 [Microbulbifer sp. NKW57]